MTVAISDIEAAPPPPAAGVGGGAPPPPRGPFSLPLAQGTGASAPRRGGRLRGEPWTGSFICRDRGWGQGNDRDAGDRGDRQGRGDSRLRPTSAAERGQLSGGASGGGAAMYRQRRHLR